MAIAVDPAWWKKAFDDIYLITDARSVCDQEITKREIDVVWDLLRMKPGIRILDLCGGHGRHSVELIKRGLTDCTLLDFSHYLVDYAADHARRMGLPLTCIRADARETGLSPDSFDAVLIMGNSMGYIPEQEADLSILRESLRLLKRGGRVLVDVADGNFLCRSLNPNAWHEIGDDIIVCRERELGQDRVNAREIVISRREGLLRDHTYSIRIYTPDRLKQLLLDAGFNGIEIHTQFTPHDHHGDYGCMNNRMIGIGSKP
jgi:D-alanine-D-alanine ligase